MNDYRDFAIGLARRAGVIMRQNFSLGMKREWKGDGTPITVTDTTINDMVVKAVQEKYPTHGVIAEEGNNFHDQEYVWVCDPVDGTIPFAHGLPLSSFSLGLVVNGVSMLGVLYDPFMDRMFVGEEGQPSTMNDQPIRVSPMKTFDHAAMTVEHWAPSQYDLFPLVRELEQRNAFCFAIKSFAYAAALVASGELVAAVYAGTFPWDGAAVKAIVTGAGGQMTDLFGAEPRWDKPLRGIVASNGVLHDEIVAALPKFE